MGPLLDELGDPCIKNSSFIFWRTWLFFYVCTCFIALLLKRYLLCIRFWNLLWRIITLLSLDPFCALAWLCIMAVDDCGDE